MREHNMPDTSAFREQLLGFNKKVARLEQTRFFKGPEVAFSLNRAPARILSANRIVAEDGKPGLELQLRAEIGDFDLHHLDRDNLEAFILTYRLLTQNNDRYSIARLADNYKFAHPFFHDAFNHLREQNALFLSTGSSLQPNGVPVEGCFLLLSEAPSQQSPPYLFASSQLI